MVGKSSDTVSNLTSEQRLQLLVARVSDYAIFMLDPEGHVSSWNAGAQRFKGYHAHEIIGQHFSVFYTEQDQAAGVPARALQTAREEGRFEAEGWRVRKDGTRFWASVVIDRILDDAGNLVGFAKITRDITERKAAQEALLESEERFRMLVQGVTDYAIFMVSPTGHITNWNAGAQRVKGYTEEEVVGTHFSRFYTEEDRREGVPAHVLEMATREGRYELEGWRVRKDGTRFWAHVVIDAIRDEQGKLRGFAKITRDVTERKAAAETLERANAALFQSQKLEAIGQLTGGIAHDFNNLLAVISSSLDVLSLRFHDERDLKLVASMRRAVHRGATLTGQLLSFARQQSLKVDKYNLNTLIGEFEAVLRRATDSSITFNIELGNALWTVTLDAARFEAALLNLVLNARDAMPNGGTLTLATENIDVGDRQVGTLAAGKYVKVSVIDTGTGMSPEVAARAYEPFFTTKGVGQGTGLGLSQVYGFIAQSGGDVTLESKLGKGTTVSIFLPAVSDALVAQPETVLIVDDEPDLLEVASVLFQSMGYAVLTAGNVLDAMETLKRRPNINVLFTDVVMPRGMSGLDLARFTRANYPAIKIVLVSGYPLPALKDQHGDLDEFVFMNKPYHLPELEKKLRTAAAAMREHWSGNLRF
jgi:PAS domain S-box-containing protein